MSMSTPPSRPRPGAVRTAAAETSARWPPRIIVRPSAVAPALVPATTSPPPMIKSRPLGIPSLTWGKLPRVIQAEPRAKGWLLAGVGAEAAAAAADHGRLGQFLGNAQQRVRGALHDLGRHFENPPSLGPRHGPEQLERLPRPQPVPLGQHPDGLLHPDSRGQRVFQLRDGLLQLARVRRLAAVKTGGGLGLAADRG